MPIFPSRESILRCESDRRRPVLLYPEMFSVGFEFLEGDQCVYISSPCVDVICLYCTEYSILNQLSLLLPVFWWVFFFFFWLYYLFFFVPKLHPGICYIRPSFIFKSGPFIANAPVFKKRKPSMKILLTDAHI